MNLKIILCIFTCSFLAGCTSSGDPGPNFPDTASLKLRVQTLYQAESSHDWKSFYQILAPPVKKNTSYNKFLEEREMWPAYNKLEWAIDTIEPTVVPDAKNYPGAKVSMDATYIHTDGRREKTKDQTDYWIYIEGKWYWFYRGYPAD